MKTSLELLAGYVPDAFALSKPFAPENTRFGVYTFVPWVRSGLSAALEPAAGGALRATVKTSIIVRGEAGESEPAGNMLTLRGPGDVIDLDPAQIIRRVPQRDAVDAEENILAHIEFDRPELPWLFSPLSPIGDRLQPWLALVVCDASSADILPGPPGFPQQLRTRRGELQPLDDAWAWAHAQVLGAAGHAPTVSDRLSASHGPANLSRILCPRRLLNRRTYIAVLVPTFDCGAKAGLNLPGGDLKPAWDATNPEGEIVLPVYDSWRFSTAPEGDFEKLAKRLRGVPAPWNVGRRLIDASKPGPPIGDLAPGGTGAVQVFKCALVSPAPAPRDMPPESSAWNATTRDKLRSEADRVNNSDENLPRVGARLYARFQRGAQAIGAVFGEPPSDTVAADADWFSQLNTSPMHRVAAGLGTRVVQRDQEQLMQAAWQQVGGIRKANEAVVRMQFARYVGEALHRNHLTKLNLGQLVQVMRGVQSKVRATGAEFTLHGVLARSAVAPAAVTAAFRRLARTRGPLARFSDAAALNTLVASGGQFRDFRRAYVEPEGVRTLSSAAVASFSPELIAGKLGVSPAAARGALTALLAARRGGPSIADQLTEPLAEWRIPTGAVDLGLRGAALIHEGVGTALPARITAGASRAEALAPLLVGVGNSKLPEFSASANRIVRRIGRQLPFSGRPRLSGLPTHIGVAAVRPLVGAAAMPTARSVEAPAARLRFESAASREVTGALVSSRVINFTDLAFAVSQTVRGDGVATLPRTPERPALKLSQDELLTAIAPAASVTEYARARFGKVNPLLAADWWNDGRVAPIMAAPRFPRAMFEALNDYDRDWLIPGLGEIALTDFVTVLATNPVFVETFLVGLSDEMGRELLWRGFPTDQRGTYFHRFWDRSADDLRTEIHRFERTPLGSHLADAGSAEGCVALIIRGELVRRFPEALVLAMRAGGSDAEGRPEFTADAKDQAPILFNQHLAPDIRLVGFKLRPSQIRTEAWWFLITENPSGPRFGLDLADDDNAPAGDHVARNHLDWNDLGALRSGRFLSALARTLIVKDKDSDPQETTWPGNSAIVARTLLQNPVRAAFDAQKLIAPALPTQ
jgi:hypothetical protein